MLVKQYDYLDQITKLHQAIYEEWYFKKMMELGDATSKIENIKDIRKIREVKRLNENNVEDK